MSQQEDLDKYIKEGGPVPKSLLGVKLKVKATVRKFNGDGAFDPNAIPFETVTSEDEIVLGGPNAAD